MIFPPMSDIPDFGPNAVKVLLASPTHFLSLQITTFTCDAPTTPLARDAALGTREQNACEPHSGLRRDFRPTLGRKSDTLSAGTPLCPYGIAHRRTYGLILGYSNFRVIQKYFCSRLCAEKDLRQVYNGLCVSVCNGLCVSR